MKRWLPDALLLAGLSLYVIAGAGSVPFHGDESTQIYMSRDYYYAIQSRDIDAVEYHDPPYDAAMQELRIINGTIGKFSFGFAWDMAGMTVNDLNEQWVWEWSLDQNKALGHMPSDHLLRVSRWPSAIFTALTVLLIFGITRRVANRPAAWAASLLYATHPVVLMNGRRAMMEGSLMFFSVLVVLLAIVTLRHKRAFGWYVALGLAAGCTMASKHNGALSIAAAFAAVAIWPLLNAVSGGGRTEGAPTRAGYREQFLRTAAYLGIAGGVALLTFLALNPTWWSDPIHMPSRVWQSRSALLDGQIAYYGGLDNPGEHLRALLNDTFFAEPQYYEVEVWDSYIGKQIRDYENSGLGGRDGSLLDQIGLLSRKDAVLGWGILMVALFSFGLVDLAARFRQPAAWVVLVWMGVTMIGLLILIPLEWQRYYLPMQAPLSVIAGVGTWRILGLAWKRGMHAAV